MKAGAAPATRGIYPELKPDDFKYLLFSHPLGADGQVHLTKPWYVLGDQLDLVTK